MRHRFALMLMLIGLLVITVTRADTTSAHLLAGRPVPFASDARKAKPTLEPQPGAPSTPASSVKVTGLVNTLFFHGSESRKEVALTFDDGPDITYTPEILTTLSQYHLHATFFMIGQHVLAYPQITRRIYAAGHIIGNHSWSHLRLTAISPAQVLWQMEHTNQIIQQTIGIKPTLMRPPYEAINRMVRIQIAKAGLVPTIGDVDSKDWQRPGVATIVQTTLSKTQKWLHYCDARWRWQSRSDSGGSTLDYPGTRTARLYYRPRTAIVRPLCR
ncbi:polysaccharide deacetylase family protein [Dictyobacter formicarum]|uniref:NodB homology domain-containing protein n=1 Tax=Dictyobacter formicarum TaxID=2778368 RepID=A0ABQ3VL93_9CHLR|nr:polysaccharide deacetylase family protein [Dictyobacter formicarum]GHO86436.1 hypothetical protein KSZ_44420 [Dictyobacter formicarum]